MRLDGSYAMMAWSLGAATGHVAMAMWRDSQLFICESTVEGPHWPLANGMQCNDYDVWMNQALEMDIEVVWAPLR